MISRTHRFHGHGSLRFVYQNGKTVRSPLFALKSAVNPRRSSYRAAVVVSRKVHKSAVARNRMRRRLYEALRSQEKDIKEPVDIVITVFSEKVMEEPYENLLAQLKKQLCQAGIIKFEN